MNKQNINFGSFQTYLKQGSPSRCSSSNLCKTMEKKLLSFFLLRISHNHSLYDCLLIFVSYISSLSSKTINREVSLVTEALPEVKFVFIQSQESIF
jgi:hypothetical protein